MSEVTVPDLEDFYKELNIPQSAAGEKLRKLGRVVCYKKRRKLPLHEEEGGLLYLLVSGSTCCEAETPDGRSVLECICYRSGEVCNPVGMFTEKIGNESCICLLNSAFVVFPLQEVIELMQEDMELMGIYSKCLKEALGEQARHKYMLSLRAEERYIWFLKNYSDIPKQISQRTVAEFLNMNQATLARIRKKLKLA